MPRLGARQDRRRDKSDDQKEYQCQENALNSESCLSGDKIRPLCIAEEKLADKRTEARGKHADVQVFIVIEVSLPQVQKRGKKARQHVEEIEPVKAMGYDEEKARQCIYMGMSLQPVHEQGHRESAKSGVQKSGRHASDHEIVCDQRSRRCKNAEKVCRERPESPRISSSRYTGHEKRCGKAKRHPVDNFAVAFL